MIAGLSEMFKREVKAVIIKDDALLVESIGNMRRKLRQQLGFVVKQRVGSLGSTSKKHLDHELNQLNASHDLGHENRNLGEPNGSQSLQCASRASFEETHDIFGKSKAQAASRGGRRTKEVRSIKNVDMVYIAHMFALKDLLHKNLNEGKTRDPSSSSCLGTKLESLR
jgi:hypothetical protein